MTQFGMCVVRLHTGRGAGDTPLALAGLFCSRSGLAGRLLFGPPKALALPVSDSKGAAPMSERIKGALVMTFRKHKIMGLTLLACLGFSAVPHEAAACGGEWFPEQTVDPRIHGIARAEQLLSHDRLAAAASVIRMIPHIKSLKAAPGSLVGRAERVLAVALSRSQGALPVEAEVSAPVLAAFRGRTPAEALANLEWSARVLERQSTAKADDVSLKTDLAEALARLPERRAEARALLEDLSKRDLIASPEGYAALASLRSASGDVDGKKAALERCQAMAKTQGVCALVG